MYYYYFFIFKYIQFHLKFTTSFQSPFLKLLINNNNNNKKIFIIIINKKYSSLIFHSSSFFFSTTKYSTTINIIFFIIFIIIIIIAHVTLIAWLIISLVKLRWGRGLVLSRANCPRLIALTRPCLKTPRAINSSTPAKLSLIWRLNSSSTGFSLNPLPVPVSLSYGPLSFRPSPGYCLSLH